MVRQVTIPTGMEESYDHQLRLLVAMSDHKDGQLLDHDHQHLTDLWQEKFPHHAHSPHLQPIPDIPVCNIWNEPLPDHLFQSEGQPVWRNLHC